MRYLHAYLVLIGVLLSACGGGDMGTANRNEVAAASAPTEGRSIRANVAGASTPTTDVQVKSLIKVSETRVSRTVFDYVFRVELANSGAALTNVKGTVTTAGDGTTIIDGNVAVGNIAAGKAVTPLDTIALRHDRAKPFSSAALVWSFTSETGGPTQPGTLLPGALTDAASAHLDPYTADRTDADLQVFDGINPAGIYRQQIYATIKAGATVGNVNDALNTVAGRLVFIEKNSPVVTIQIPEQGSIAALEGVANALVNTHAFESVSLVTSVEPNAIPGDINNVTQLQAVTPGGPVFHHLAARFGGLWNLRNMAVAPHKVQLIVVDWFGDGAVAGIAGDASVFKTGVLCKDPVTKVPNSVKCQHGYHVLGIMSGSFGGADSDVERVTGGASTFALDVHVIDVSGNLQRVNNEGKLVAILFDEYVAWRLRSIVANQGSKYVMNISAGYPCSNDIVNGGCKSLSVAQNGGQQWRNRMRNIWPLLPATVPFNYEVNLVQVTAAGNGGHAAESGSASLQSNWNAAVLLGNEAALKNGLVVENRTAKLVNGIPVIDALSASSTVGGNTAAVGTNVFSFIGPTTAGWLSGTSMASPQVAGLVASMLTVRDTVSPQDVVQKVINKRFIADTSAVPAIDAYAAMLSMDNGLTDAPVRQAILRASVNSPGPATKQLMTYDDVSLFLRAYFPGGYAGPPVPQPAFSRYDLNGDGYDGDVGRRVPFDMQLDGSNQPFVPTKINMYPTQGSPIIKLDEASATDFQILCYYINSPLFDATYKPTVDAELARLSSVLNKRVSCADRTVILEIKDNSPGWIGLPATITMKNFVTPFPATFAGNSSTCTNQGAVAGERGVPLFSASVSPPAAILAAIEVDGMPQSSSGGAINRRNCSSFFAQYEQQVWINATGRAVFGFGGVAVSDWEYQVRYSNGINGVGKRCSLGTVANANFFGASFEASTCAHEVTATVAE